MKALLASVLIITTFTVSLVNGQIENRFFYKNRDDSKDDNTNVQLLEESSNAIPLEFFEQINNVSDMSEFIKKFVDTENTDPKLGIDLLGDDSAVNERAGSRVAKYAACEPQSTVVPLVPLNPSKDPSIFYHPPCTRVNRCGGCCSSPLLSCQPIDVETIGFTILKLQYAGGAKMPLNQKEHVLVEQHKSCKCLCRIKKEDCNSYQVYDPQECKCNCTNYTARDKCLRDVNKIWDYNTCKCRCRETQECTTGTYFDDHECKCTEIYGIDPASTLLDRRRFIVKAIPVEPSNTTLYSTDEK